MKINNLGLLNSLSSIINSGTVEGIDYVLAEYMLKNLHRISETSILELTEECYTSRSAVRRFCIRLGYNNFSQLKGSVTKLVFPSNLSLRDIKECSSYQWIIKNLIDDIINDINEQITFEKINYLCKLINRDVKIIFLCANNTSGTIIRFQQELMYASKIIHVISNSFTTNEILKSLNDEDIIITISASGKFVELSLNLVKGLKGHKILITGNKDSRLTSEYDKVFYISKNNITDDYQGLYGKYGITYILDLISTQFLFLYS